MANKWVREAKALLEMGAGLIDANTVRGMLRYIAKLEREGRKEGLGGSGGA